MSAIEMYLILPNKSFIERAENPQVWKVVLYNKILNLLVSSNGL